MLIHKSFIATTADGSFPAQLSWTDTDPYAARADFKAAEDGGWVEWTIALDLLERGCVSFAEAGVGDARVWLSSDENTVSMRLNSPEGVATVDLPYDAVCDFTNEVDDANVPSHRAKAVETALKTFLVELNVDSF